MGLSYETDLADVRTRALEQFRWYTCGRKARAELAVPASTLLPQDGSPDEEALLAHLDRHVASEEAVLDSYVQFARSGPEFVRYLVNLIAEDEERHHRILREMVNRVVGEMEFRTKGPSIPSTDFQGTDRERLVEETARFLALERDDLASLKQLTKSLRRQRLRGLIPVLVEFMELDTKKHIALLEFIGQSAASTD
jgi:hypothetical protein